LNTDVIVGALTEPACSYTANFIKEINDLFDCQNSQSHNDSNPLHSALSAHQQQVENCLTVSFVRQRLGVHGQYNSTCLFFEFSVKYK